jgi:hypothetical protein
VAGASTDSDTDGDEDCEDEEDDDDVPAATTAKQNAAASTSTRASSTSTRATSTAASSTSTSKPSSSPTPTTTPAAPSSIGAWIDAFLVRTPRPAQSACALLIPPTLQSKIGMSSSFKDLFARDFVDDDEPQLLRRTDGLVWAREI